MVVKMAPFAEGGVWGPLMSKGHWTLTHAQLEGGWS